MWIKSNFPDKDALCGPGSDPPQFPPWVWAWIWSPQFPPWVWAWIWSPSISPLGVGLDLITLNFPLGCGPGSDPSPFTPWVWAWIWSPSISPLGVGLDLISLHFPLGCGPGSDPPQFLPWVWAWRGASVMAFCCGLLLWPSVMAFWLKVPFWLKAAFWLKVVFCYGFLVRPSGVVALWFGGLLVESGLLLWPSGKAFWCGAFWCDGLVIAVWTSPEDHTRRPP